MSNLRLTKSETQNHTPGPWVVKGGDVFAPAAGSTVAVPWAGCHGCDANARLIAAAPVMLAACKAAEDYCGGADDSLGWSVARTLRAAIELAEGGAS